MVVVEEGVEHHQDHQEEEEEVELLHPMEDPVQEAGQVLPLVGVPRVEGQPD